MTFTPYTIDPTLDLVLDREVDVPPELVFTAWTTPELVKQFFAPKPFETPRVEIDLRPGGAFVSVMKMPDGQEFENVGCYLDIVPNEKLMWTSALAPGFRPKDPTEGDVDMTAILELTPNGSGGCKYRAIAIHKDADTRQRHEEMGFHEGWGIVVDQLEALMKAQS